MSSKKFVKNSGWMMGQQIYSMLVSLIVGSLSARYLGPINYGIINYGSSIISFFAIISQLGLDGIIINEMIKNPGKKGEYLGTALLMRLMCSLISVVLVIAMMRIIEPAAAQLRIVTFLQALAIVFQSYEVLTSWFQMKLKMKYISLASMCALTVVAIWKVFLLIADASIYLFAFSNVIQAIVSGTCVIVIFRKLKNANLVLRFKRKIVSSLLGQSYHFIISDIAVTLYMQIDKIMIGKMINSEAVGFYAAASTVAALWEFVPRALINSARPLILEKRESNYKEYISSFQQLLLGITLLFVIVSCGMMLVGRWVVLILYGESYTGAIWPLSVLVWATGFSMIGSARGIWTIAEGYNKYTKYMVFFGSIVNISLNIIAIRVWGIMGASITTLISQVVVSLIAPLFFKKMRKFVIIYFDSFKQLPVLFKSIRNFLTSR